MRVHTVVSTCSMCVHTVVILVRVHSGITSMCVHTVVILVRVHSGITSLCVHSGITSACTQWYY